MSRTVVDQIDASSIPVIDVAGLEHGQIPVQSIGQQMLLAAERIGFFYIRNFAIPPDLIAQVFQVSQRFFAASVEQKQAVAVNTGHRGFIRMGEAKMEGSTKPDLKESFIWGHDEPGSDGIPPNRWPDFLPEMRPALMDFLTAGNDLGWWLLRSFAAAIDIPQDSFVRSIDRPISRGSIIYYPPQPPELGEDQFGVSAHTDYGCLTLLYQDGSGGLQVQGQRGGWLTAHPIPDTFVVNVGDLLARWTNDRFRSTPHRVVNRSGRARYSTAVFVDPNSDTLIQPVLRPGDTAYYDPVTCGDYYKSRLDAAFSYRKKST